MSPPTERSPLLASRHEDDDQVEETSPLLANGSHEQPNEDENGSTTSQDQSKPKRKRRWPSIVAMLVLAAVVVLVMLVGFLVPPAIKTYAENASVIEPTGLSVESITPEGVRARIQANFRLDGSRVGDDNARRIGRFATGIFRQIETLETEVTVFGPQEYNSPLLGKAMLPPIRLDLVDGHNTAIDLVVNLAPGDAEGLKAITNDWLGGKLSKIKVTGGAALSLKSGFLPLGTHDVVESIVLEANQVPAIPEYKIQHLNFHDVPIDDGGKKGVGANITVSMLNDYAIGLTVPRIGFNIAVPNCDPAQPLIMVASAISNVIQVRPKANITAKATGLIRDIPESLTRACPTTNISPLDEFMKRYLKGEDAQVFVQANMETSDLPSWVGPLVDNMTVPIDFPGRSFDELIRNLTLTDVDFKLPSPFADPEDPDSNPRVSGTVEVLAALPDGFNIDIGVDKIRAQGDLFYKGEKFGELNLRKWQSAQADKLDGTDGESDLLRITSKIIDAPIEITDGDVFGSLMQQMLFGTGEIILDVVASVDVKVDTVLGNLVIRQVPAKGKVPVKRLPGDVVKSLNPRVGDITIFNTTRNMLDILAEVSFTNPTPYTASIPYLNVHVVSHGHVIGQATIKELHMNLGNVTNATVIASWDPVGFGGEASHKEARKLLSEYLSAKNTTLTIRTHRDSVPGSPLIGEALSKLNLTFQTPHLQLPDDDGDDDEDDGNEKTKTGFIRDAVFHIFSSAATFRLASPLKHDVIRVERINATAFYNHTEPVGRIVHNEPFDAPPGISETPHLPVDWELGSVGFDKMRDALGGSLRLDAIANVTVRIGYWIEEIFYQGRGIGAKVSL